MADEKSGSQTEPAKAGEAATQDSQGGDRKPAGVGPVDKKPEVEQQPT